MVCTCILTLTPAYEQGYAPLTSGLEHHVFIRDKTGKSPAEGRVWPGQVYFPDFLHPNASAYWDRQLVGA